MVKSESGFSSVEVIVATFLLSIGILGVARASADMTRMMSTNDQMVTAAVYTQDRVEILRSAGCNAMANGNEKMPGGFELRWTISKDTDLETNTMRVYVSYATSRGYRADTVETLVSCG